MKALAEQPPGMRRRTVIVAWERATHFALDPDMRQVAVLRGVAGEGAPLLRHLGGGRLEYRLVAVLSRKAARVDPAAGKIVGGEFPDREPVAKPGGEGVGGVMV